MLFLLKVGLVVAFFVGLWKVYAKAGQPGWIAVIPILNLLALLKMANKPVWWLILLCIPGVNVVTLVVVKVAVARNFGKGALFGLGLTFLPFVFYPLLGFGGARYLGTAR